MHLKIFLPMLGSLAVATAVYTAWLQKKTWVALKQHTTKL